MTTIHITVKDSYVDHLLSLLSNQKSIVIDAISIDDTTKNSIASNSALDSISKKNALLRIVDECASLPTINQATPEEILGYDQSQFGLWGEN